MARLLVLSVVGLILSAFLALQAASLATAKTRPDIAASLMPVGNEPLNRLIGAGMASGVQNEADLRNMTAAMEPYARQAVERGPLGPEAHAVLIMNTADAERRSAMIAAASKLNRRDMLLQGLVLDDRIKAGDFPGAVQTLDRILRVRPAQRAALFPILIDALKDERSLPAFALVLDGSSQWHDQFLASATSEAEALPQLASLHERMGRRIPEFERLLVAALVRQGDLENASRIYSAATGGQSSVASTGRLGWSTRLAPFDWRLEDEAGFRAQPINNGEALEIFVRSGKGGVIAERLIAPPAAPFAIEISQRIVPVDQLRDVRLELRCRGSREPFYDERFSAERARFQVASLPANCAYVMLGINARAWSGRSPLRGTIESITITK